MSEKLLVPADIYDEALAFCNARRAERGMEPITELPAGYGARPWSCPCANGVPGLKVYLVTWQINGLPGKTADPPSSFVNFFDLHAKPGVLTLPVREESRNG